MSPAPPDTTDRREREDRRKRHLPWYHPRRLHGRRRGPRRGEEEGAFTLVERVPPWVFVFATLILILTIADGYLTVALLDHGFEEVNPVMRYLLTHGAWAFLVGKYVLTAVFLPVALVTNRHRLFRSGLRVGHFVPLVAALYVVLVGYQIALVRMHRVPVGVDLRSIAGFATQFTFTGTGDRLEMGMGTVAGNGTGAGS